MKEVLTHMSKLNLERQVLINTLAVWDHVQNAGHTVEDVRAFSFRPKFLNRNECKRLGRNSMDKSDCKTHHNCAVYNDGTVHEIPLIPRPSNVQSFSEWQKY